jgi:hypothetical protein
MDILTISIVGAVLVIGGLFSAIVLRRRLAANAPHSHCRCPACDQKIRYLLSKAGKPVQCPRCPERFNLPTAQEQLSVNKNPSLTLKRSKSVGARA